MSRAVRQGQGKDGVSQRVSTGLRLYFSMLKPGLVKLGSKPRRHGTTGGHREVIYEWSSLILLSLLR